MKYLCHLTQAKTSQSSAACQCGPHARVPRATAAICCMYDQLVNEAIALICTILGACALSPSENMQLSFSVRELW